MTESTSVVVVTESTPSAEAVGAALQSHSRFQLAQVVHDLPALSAHFEHSPTPAVLVDIDAAPGPMLARLDALTSRYADTRFVVISETLCSDRVLEAMQVGVRATIDLDTIVG